MDTLKIAERIAAPYIEAAGKLPEELKKNQFTKNDPDNPNPKGNDRDGDGKTNEAKPFKGTEVPRGVVAALTVDGVIEIFAANNAEAADGIKTALMAKDGEYASIVHGPNSADRTINELYAHFEERWAGCEKLPEGGMRDNCEKKSKGGDSDDKKDDKKEAGCEKLPAGGMRDNCEKKSKGGGKGDDKKDDKKDDSKGDDKKDGKMPADLLDKFKKKK